MKTILATGCYDLLHRGHVEALEMASCLYDGELIVGINSDESVRRLKGKNRPINNENDRAFMLTALRVVSRVVVFDEDTVCELLKREKPDIWIKSQDYTLETLNQNERRTAESLGIEIRFMPVVEGLSTTKILSRLNT
jgi:rfaE bifunctional protein nucleotidyltransferase chain/domain